MALDALWWLFLNFLSLIVLAFYSMMEMACVSFNRVRLNYYVSKGKHKAILLNELLHNPAKLFGTTLIGVNIALVYGSEFSREFHIAIGVSPDLAPLSQVFIVVIFGELAPMFAARSYPEHMVMLGIPLIYASAKLMKPILWVIDLITKLCNWMIGEQKNRTNIYITQEELQKILEEQEEEMPYASDKEQFNKITSNIFSLRKKDAKHIMTPILNIPLIPSNATVEEARRVFLEKQADYLPIYHNEIGNIIAIAFPRDLIRTQDTRKAREGARVPWFVAQTTKLTHILKQFRHNTQQVAIILDERGSAVGVINFDDVIEEIFGKMAITKDKKKVAAAKKQVMINRTFPANLKVKEFNAQFDITLNAEKEFTLAQLIEKELGHHPEIGESIYIDPFELSVKEASLLGVKSVLIKTKIE